jgi:hypothetical protein
VAERIWTKYTADNGVSYKVKISSAWADPTYGLWVVFPITGLAELPQGMIMRHAVLKHVATGRRRIFPIQIDSAAFGWVIGRQFFLPTNAGDWTLWEVTGLVGQKYQPRHVRKKRY